MEGKNFKLLNRGVLQNSSYYLFVFVTYYKMVTNNSNNNTIQLNHQSKMKFTYGTAGFRMDASLLDTVMERVGMFAALLSQSNNGQCVGVMITASHNPINDNGCKIVAPTGEMMEGGMLEDLVTGLVNCAETEVEKCCESIRKQLKCSSSPLVLIGMDTRPSGPHLFRQCQRGVERIGGGGKVYTQGTSQLPILTTPQLHSFVKAINSTAVPPSLTDLESGYINEMAEAFVSLCSSSKALSARELRVDAANGVGGEKILQLDERLRHIGGDAYLRLTLLDEDGQLLNEQCGADYVKTCKASPRNCRRFDNNNREAHHASLDGDADRVVFFHPHNGEFHLFDGDRIAVLIAEHFQRLLKEHGHSQSFSLGVIQTAYANGESTSHLRNLGIPVLMTKTGVKHLHRAAKQFDLGVYFEANGHGTVLISQRALEAIPALVPYARLINQLVGDGIADMLLVEAILRLDWQGDLLGYLRQSYQDLPNRLEKLRVPDRHALKTGGPADEVVLEPPGLHDRIQEAVGRIGGRAFVRPSGTEDVVRVYAEAATPEKADALVEAVMAIVRESVHHIKGILNE